MPFSAGPNIAARPNLVFEYDTGDVQNSYKGEPTTNISDGLRAQGGSWTLQSQTYNGAPVYRNVVTSPSTFNNFGFASTSQVNLNQSGPKYLTISFYANVIVSPGSLYGYIVVRFTDSTEEQYGWTYDPSNWATTNIGQWQFVKATVALNPAKTPQNTVRWYVYRDNATVGTVDFGAIQLEQKDHPTPYVAIGTTRSNTQGLLDVSGLGNTVDLANMSYTSTAQFTFDGTDDYSLITNSSALQIVDNITIESVVRVNSSNLGNVKVMANKYYTTGWEFVLGSDGTFALGGRNGDGTYYSTNSGVVIADNKFHHIVGIKSGLYWQTYVDGVLKSTLTAGSIGSLSNSGDIQLGKEGNSYFTAMSMNMFRIYNIGLSATQVLQNYNQLKGRFNLQ